MNTFVGGRHGGGGGSGGGGTLLTELGRELSPADDLAEPTAGLQGAVAVRVEVGVAYRVADAENAAVRVDHVYEVGIRGAEVAPLACPAEQGEGGV